MGKGYTVQPFSFNRKMVTASVAIGSERHTIHAVAEVDITTPRKILAEHAEKTGEKLSFTAFIVATVARAITSNPDLNSFRKGNRLITLDDVTVNTIVEREYDGHSTPDSLAIHAAQRKSHREIHDEIRAAQQSEQKGLGSLSGVEWVRYLPNFLLKTFVRLASNNLYMQKKFGVVCVTAVGMFGKMPVWFVPVTAATTTVTVGGIVKRPVLVDGIVEEREQLCLTFSFDHDIIDGGPAARFIRKVSDMLQSAEVLSE